jgi:ABC-2 type transport system permease protein
MKKEFIHIKRDEISLRIALLMPVMLMLLFGYAVNTEVDNIKTAVLDRSKTQASREYIDKFSASGYFNVTNYIFSEDELASLIDTGKVRAGIIIPEDFSSELNKNENPNVEIVVDGSDPTTARTALSSGVLVSENYSQSLRNRFIDKMGISNSLPGVKINIKTRYNPNLETKKFTIPGLLGVIMQNITVLLTAFAFVREKESGTIEQLMVTPVKAIEIITAKMLPFVIIGMVGFFASLAICIFWFKINIVGSVLLLILLGLLFVICSLSLGMLISTFAQNQTQAMLGTLAVLLPSIILTGFIFPREAMPPFIAGIGNFIPLTYFVSILRGIVLKGSGFYELLPQVVPLTLITIVLLAFASLRVRKSLD